MYPIVCDAFGDGNQDWPARQETRTALLSGASHETATEAGELNLEGAEQGREAAHHGPLLELERRLAAPETAASGAVTMTRLSLETTDAPAPERPREEGLRGAG